MSESPTKKYLQVVRRRITRLALFFGLFTTTAFLPSPMGGWQTHRDGLPVYAST
jgi:hypothetical protein